MCFPLLVLFCRKVDFDYLGFESTTTPITTREEEERVSRKTTTTTTTTTDNNAGVIVVFAMTMTTKKKTKKKKKRFFEEEERFCDFWRRRRHKKGSDYSLFQHCRCQSKARPETRLGAHSIPGEVVPSAFRVRTRRHDALLPPDGDEDAESYNNHFANFSRKKGTMTQSNVKGRGKEETFLGPPGGVRRRRRGG